MNGNEYGWACPYGLDTSKLNDSSECGLCLECIRSCDYENVTLYKRPFASELSTSNYAQAWQTIAIFTLAIVYSILYVGHWPGIRDYVNITDKKNWDLFGLYTLVMWLLVLIIVPAVLFLLSRAGFRISHAAIDKKLIFLKYSGNLLPLGLMLWIAFVIPMFFVNITFILQSLSDPFGWGWDFFGTANIPWHQFIPEYIPWIQSIVILGGFYYSLRNLKRSFHSPDLKPLTELRLLAPMVVFLVVIAVAAILFHTN